MLKPLLAAVVAALSLGAAPASNRIAIVGAMVFDGTGATPRPC